MAAYLKRFVVCSAVVISTGAATWLNPPAQPGVAPAKQSQPAITSQLGSEISPNPRGDVAADAGISVTRWEFSPAIPGRPVYLSMTLDGTQTAIDRMQTGPLAIQVHWVRENAGAAPGAPELVTDLTIGRPDWAAALAEEVRRKGFFECQLGEKRHTQFGNVDGFADLSGWAAPAVRP